MHRIFKTTGKFHWVTDAKGDPINNDMPGWDVFVDAKYQLKPTPQQPLVLDVYGYNLLASPQCAYKLVLDNGVVLTGRASGGSISNRPNESSKLQHIRMFDFDQTKLELHPNEPAPHSSAIDAAVFGIVSSALSSIGNGFARPSIPFSYTKDPDQLRTWTTQASRLNFRNLEITIVGTSNYWRKLVDKRTLRHDSVVGIRVLGGGDLPWTELNDFTSLFSDFLGWLNHGAAPIFHVKGYSRGRVVYRGYELHPHASIQRDSFSWFPSRGIEFDNGGHAQNDFYVQLLQDLLHCFASTWENNAATHGTFHIALQLLRGGDKGGPLVAPSITYLRDAFTASALIEQMLTQRSAKSGRQAQIARCLKQICVKDKLPALDKLQTEITTRAYPDLWRSSKTGQVLHDERLKATLSRPLANIHNWLLHPDDPFNAQRLLGLGSDVQRYMVEVSIWLADLMILKVVDYNGWYFDRLSMSTERVPWATRHLVKHYQ